MGVVHYRDTHDFSPEELQALFLSVDWSSGHFPDRLVIAMKNYETVYTAWDGDKLIGLISAMDDGGMNAYVHYLLVTAPGYSPIQGFAGTAGPEDQFVAGGAL